MQSTSLRDRYLCDVRQLPDERLALADQAFIPVPDMDFMERLLNAVIDQSLNCTTAFFRPRGALLFHGPAGSGKTSLSGILPQRWAVSTGRTATWARLNSHALASGEYGQTQKNVAKLFDTLQELCASGDPVFAACDEFETMATSRDEISGRTSPVDARNAVNALLEKLDGRPRNLFLIATTNVGHYLDAAALDRFDQHFLVELPDDDARLLALNSMVQSIAPESDALETAKPSQTKALATLTAGYSFRGIERLVLTCRALHLGSSRLTPRQLILAATFLKKNNLLVLGPAHS